MSEQIVTVVNSGNTIAVTSVNGTPTLVVKNGTTGNDPIGNKFTDGVLTSVGSGYVWVNFIGGSSPIINAQNGVSSVVYNSTGLYTINFSSSFIDSNFALSFGSSQDGSGNPVVANEIPSSRTNSSVQISFFSLPSGVPTPLDPSIASVMIMR
jgi:hypothetical protein